MENNDIDIKQLLELMSHLNDEEEGIAETAVIMKKLLDNPELYYI